MDFAVDAIYLKNYQELQDAYFTINNKNRKEIINNQKKTRIFPHPLPSLLGLIYTIQKHWENSREQLIGMFVIIED